jgi:hypothetical protein
MLDMVKAKFIIIIKLIFIAIKISERGQSINFCSISTEALYSGGREFKSLDAHYFFFNLFKVKDLFFRNLSQFEVSIMD